MVHPATSHPLPHTRPPSSFAHHRRPHASAPNGLSRSRQNPRQQQYQHQRATSMSSTNTSVEGLAGDPTTAMGCAIAPANAIAPRRPSVPDPSSLLPGCSPEPDPGHHRQASSLGTKVSPLPLTMHQPPTPSPISASPPTIAPAPASRLPNLNLIRPHLPSLIAASRSIDDHTTHPFRLDWPPYSDTDVPLPEAYNAAYPHPLTAYASHGVNPASIRAVGWKEALLDLMRRDPEGVKGSILASSQREVHAPVLMAPLMPGEGCAIPERLWRRFESMADVSGGVAAPVSQTNMSTPGQAGDSSNHYMSTSHAVPPRFIQAGINIISTPGTRSRSDHANAHPTEAQLPYEMPLPAECIAPIRTNFSNVLRRTSIPTDPASHGAGAGVGSTWPSARAGRRPSVQPTPFHKTELCGDWQLAGTCKYGSNCQFAHGLSELRAPIAPAYTPPGRRDSLPHPNPITTTPVREYGGYDLGPVPRGVTANVIVAAYPPTAYAALPTTLPSGIDGNLPERRASHPNQGPIAAAQPSAPTDAVQSLRLASEVGTSDTSLTYTPPIGAERAWRTMPVSSSSVSASKSPDRPAMLRQDTVPRLFPLLPSDPLPLSDAHYFDPDYAAYGYEHEYADMQRPATTGAGASSAPTQSTVSAPRSVPSLDHSISASSLTSGSGSALPSSISGGSSISASDAPLVTSATFAPYRYRYRAPGDSVDQSEPESESRGAGHGSGSGRGGLTVRVHDHPDARSGPFLVETGGHAGEMGYPGQGRKTFNEAATLDLALPH